ncbi:MAG: ATP synthase F1 subunit gamma [Lachnospiraceae bacterium]|nr:ATP synthase F1 subunit gamma [Lachnospiraceae bacterium]
MAGLREISGRIRSVKDTMKITNAMYMISSTKLRKAKKDAELNNPYFEAMQEMLLGIMNSSDHLKHRYTDRRPDKKGTDRTHAVIVVTADKGLAGAYNHNVVRLTEEKFLTGKESVRLFVVGEAGRQYFAGKKVHLEGQFKYTAQNPTLHRARVICDEMLEEFNSGKCDDVSIVYTGMKDQLTSEARVMHLLPIVPDEVDGRISVDDVRDDLKFLPSASEVMDIIVPDLLMGYIYSVLVESYCSEQNDRMMAMDAADRNGSEMIKRLSIQYNRERQSMITQEITEVASGARAQKKAKSRREEKHE